MIRKTIATLALTIGVGVIALPAEAGDQHRDWAPCRFEDGSGQKRCIWDARHMGNGRGQSGKIFNGGEDDMRWVPISHRLAHHLITQH